MNAPATTIHDPEMIALWAERRRVKAHLTGGRADPDKCVCRDMACLIAQDVADYFHSFS